jgi:parallel beta-helix repeat protein
MSMHTPRPMAAVVAIALLLTGRAHAADVKLLKQPTQFPIVITEPGSYRLTSNLVVPDANTTAIRVESRDVTIDLNGFAILGPVVCSGIPVSCNSTGAGGYGIVTRGNAGTRENVTVRNGTVRGMGADGVYLDGQATIEGVRAISNGNNGILANQGSRIVGNVGIANGNRGIATAERCIVTGNVANENSIGINVNSQSLVSGNIANFNSVDGITCEDSCTITGNTAHGNGLGGSGGRGIVTSSSNTVIGNTATGNVAVGLLLTGSSASGYVHNVVNGNNGGDANPQVSGGTQMGANVCGGDTTCP